MPSQRARVIDSITYFSKYHSLPAPLLMAVAEAESNFEPTAIRYEPGYRWLWNVGRDTPYSAQDAEICPDDFPGTRPGVNGYSTYASGPTEWAGQKTSWGVFQMMGAVLRERGYKGPFANLCCIPELAARFACEHIKVLHNKYHDRHGWAGVIAAYNAGRPRQDESGAYLNQAYVNKIAELSGGGLITTA